MKVSLSILVVLIVLTVITICVALAYNTGLHTCHVKVPYSCDVEQP